MDLAVYREGHLAVEMIAQSREPLLEGDDQALQI